jgi:hypothetical protein
MKTKRELAQEQLDLMEIIRGEANINMVTCGHCGTILLHDMDREFKKDPLVCFGCKTEHTDASDCPDYWYNGCIESSEFDEDEPTLQPTKQITIADVATIAMDLKINASVAEINEVLKYYDSEVDQDPTATWELIVENLLYNCVTPSNIK